MSGDISLRVMEAEGGWFPEEISLRELEGLAQQDFATRDMRIVQGFFNRGDPSAPTLDFLVIGKNQAGKLAMGSLVEQDSVDGHTFLYVNKANVGRKYYGNGYLNEMVDAVREIAERRGLPVALRTSDERVSDKYAKSSDIKTFQKGYYIHGFGFLPKKDPNVEVMFTGKIDERFPGAYNLFHNKIASYVAAKPATVVPRNGLVLPRGYDESKVRYLRLHPFANKAY